MNILRITSRLNPEVKKILEIKASPSDRMFVIEGARFVKEADKNNMISVFCTSPEKHEDFLNSLVNVQIYHITDEVMNKICEASSGRDLLCVLKKSYQKQPNKIIILDRLQDPGNVGTIIRTAYAFGFGVIVSDTSANPFSPKAVNSSVGSILSCFVERADLFQAIDKLKKTGYTIIASTISKQASHPEEIIKKEKEAIIIGSEGNGISPEILAVCDTSVYIPMVKPINSLNAAVAAGILIYSFSKQKRGEMLG